LPITDRNRAFARDIVDRLTDAGLRVELDDRSEKIGYKIREAQLEKVPYMLVLGDKEQESGILAVRSRKDGKTQEQSYDQFLDMVKREIKEKSL
ncbi:MAG: His/Gly/Thr/Pro-type tRNA ligase C-terminal domain-containing protein, partial [Bacillota bacterium]|nr:His/Gly/Thr/Pro-type tRNA ligase C-terminal domain-containing protein [Bacillota bacterium]